MASICWVVWGDMACVNFVSKVIGVIWVFNEPSHIGQVSLTHICFDQRVSNVYCSSKRLMCYKNNIIHHC
jgi:hypothetical protein